MKKKLKLFLSLMILTVIIVPVYNYSNSYADVIALPIDEHLKIEEEKKKNPEKFKEIQRQQELKRQKLEAEMKKDPKYHERINIFEGMSAVE